MAADRKTEARKSARRLGDESGQSMVEFLLLLPVVLGMVVIMIRMNAAITTSIVNQKYARMMLFRLNGNSAIYPVIADRQNFLSFFSSPSEGRFYNRMMLGVAARPIGETDNKPDAHMMMIARTPALARGLGPAQSEPEERGHVRIRTTVDICTQANYVDVSGSKQPISEEVMGETMVLDFCAPQPNPEASG